LRTRNKRSGRPGRDTPIDHRNPAAAGVRATPHDPAPRPRGFRASPSCRRFARHRWRAADDRRRSFTNASAGASRPVTPWR